MNSNSENGEKPLIYLPFRAAATSDLIYSKNGNHNNKNNSNATSSTQDSSAFSLNFHHQEESDDRFVAVANETDNTISTTTKTPSRKSLKRTAEEMMASDGEILDNLDSDIVDGSDGQTIEMRTNSPISFDGGDPRSGEQQTINSFKATRNNSGKRPRLDNNSEGKEQKDADGVEHELQKGNDKEEKQDGNKQNDLRSRTEENEQYEKETNDDQVEEPTNHGKGAAKDTDIDDSTNHFQLNNTNKKSNSHREDDDQFFEDDSSYDKAIDSVISNLISIEDDDDDKGEETNSFGSQLVNVNFRNQAHDSHLDTLEVEVFTEKNDNKNTGESTEDESGSKAKTSGSAVSKGNPRPTRRTATNPTNQTSDSLIKSDTNTISKKRVGPKSRMANPKPRTNVRKKARDDDEDFEGCDIAEVIEERTEESSRPRRRAAVPVENYSDLVDDVELVSHDSKKDDSDDDGEGSQKSPKEFVVEKILSKRTGRDDVGNARVEYKVKWEGYPTSQNTWEPLCNLGDCDDAIKEFEETQAAILAKKKISKASATARAPSKRTQEEYPSDDSSCSPQKKNKKSDTTKPAPATTQTPSSTNLPSIDNSDVEVTEIIGLSKCGREKYFLLKFHESSRRDPQFLRSSVAAKLIPLKVIDFYSKHIVWK